MADSRWEWSERAKRYRDLRSGRFLSRATVLGLRDDFLADRKAAMAEAVRALTAGEATTRDFLLAMRDAIRDLTAGEFVFGRGGVNATTDADRAAIGRVVAEQYAFLQEFARQVADGALSERQIAARADLYANASRQAFERGKIAAHGDPPLPHVPADGSTRCLANCACFVSIEETDTEWRVRWNTTSGETCPDCSARAREWDPLVIAKEAA